MLLAACIVSILVNEVFDIFNAIYRKQNSHSVIVQEQRKIQFSYSLVQLIFALPNATAFEIIVSTDMNKKSLINITPNRTPTQCRTSILGRLHE